MTSTGSVSLLCLNGLQGRDLLEFAMEAAGQGKCVGLLEYDPLSGEDRVEESALRQFGIVSLHEPSQIVDGAAAFLACGDDWSGGIFLEAGKGEMARLVRQSGEEGNFLDGDDDPPWLKVPGTAGIILRAGLLKNREKPLPGICCPFRQGTCTDRKIGDPSLALQIPDALLHSPRSGESAG